VSRGRSTNWSGITLLFPGKFLSPAWNRSGWLMPGLQDRLFDTRKNSIPTEDDIRRTVHSSSTIIFKKQTQWRVLAPYLQQQCRKLSDSCTKFIHGVSATRKSGYQRVSTYTKGVREVSSAAASCRSSTRRTEKVPPSPDTGEVGVTECYGHADSKRRMCDSHRPWYLSMRRTQQGVDRP